MLERFNKDISLYNESFLMKTIEARMMATSSRTPEEFLNAITDNPGEASLLLDALTNSYSEFFRNPLTFAILEQFVFPKLSNDQNISSSHEIRIWSAGCAAGQEPYSLALLAHHFKNGHQLAQPFRIFATDSSSRQLEVAQRGVFEFKALENTRLLFVNNYFAKSGNTYKIDDEIKKQVDFSVYDLLDEKSSAPPASIFGDFDIIMCSNVLLYYKPEIQKMILTKFSRSLKKNGFLVTGETEISIVKAFREFKLYTTHAAIFIKS